MKIKTVDANSLLSFGRLDSKYFLSEGLQASIRLTLAKNKGLHCILLGGADGLAKIWQPKRFRRAYAAPNENAVAYLRPYDVFEFLPTAADYLSVTRNKDIDSYRLERGLILQSCSGRNLGPAVFIDQYLSNFVVGDDMIRIEIDDVFNRNYVLAYLKSPTGQQLLKQGMTGSVIDHLSKEHIANLEVPFFDKSIQDSVVHSMANSIKLRESARLILNDIQKQFDSQLPKFERKKAAKEGWAIHAKDLTSRLDSAFYDSYIEEIKKTLLAQGGVKLKEKAQVLKPAARFKTNYVSKEFGRPILSGTQLLQSEPINLRYIASSAFKNDSDYELRQNWLAYQADGRAEETLGLPVLITSDRDGWLASGHVGRIISNSDVDAGWLYLATRCWTTQIQIKASASGSVVDSTFPWDMEEVILPPIFDEIDTSKVLEAWELFTVAKNEEDNATAIIETAFKDFVD